MDASQLEIGVDDPRREDVRGLLARHLEWARGTGPLEYAFALDLDGLLEPAVTLFSARSSDGELLAIGALKELDRGHGEIKSMHTAERARRTGIGRVMLEHLLGVARERGYGRVSLETGSMDEFAPARALYAAAGFLSCEPFGDYRASPYNTFMTLVLAGPAAS